jgi:hypothetical protein
VDREARRSEPFAMTQTEMHARANEFKPAEMADAIRSLARDGHSDLSIAQVLGLDVIAVRRLIGCVDCET